MLKFLPNRYATDPEGWLQNQFAHFGAGIVATALFCSVWLDITGEFPFRSMVFAVMILIYGVGVELIGQKWRGADTIEDTIFFAGYGAGSILYAFHEFKMGSGEFHGQIADVEPFLYLACFHWFLGTVFRIWNRRRERAE